MFSEECHYPNIKRNLEMQKEILSEFNKVSREATLQRPRFITKIH